MLNTSPGKAGITSFLGRNSQERRNVFYEHKNFGERFESICCRVRLHGMTHAYGEPADKQEMTELIAQAVDQGCTFFDTAETYGTRE